VQRENAFEVEGVILEVLPNRTYRAELANGHQLLAFVAGKSKNSFAAVPGQKVTLALSPFDLSEGRILTGSNPAGSVGQNEKTI
jgi:translation initiation factor IF-1